MCGIAGFSLSEQEAKNRAKAIAKAMLLDIENRGRDATGFAIVNDLGEFQVHKADVDATEFVKRRLCIPKNAREAILHTRLATQGRPENNLNNHPILSGNGNVVGVHNGCLYNDYGLFADINKEVGYDTRQALVDSEAIFALLGYIDQPVTKALSEVAGSAAVAWFDRSVTGDENVLHLARISSSPLVVCQTTGGSLFFASTPSAVLAGVRAGGLEPLILRDIDEGAYFAVLNGNIEDIREFTPDYSSYSRWNGWSGSSSRSIANTYGWDDNEYEYVQTGALGGTLVKRDDLHTAVAEYNAGRPKLISVPDLGARLNAEEPEVWDDEKQAEYEQWWDENMNALDHALASDNREVQERFDRAPMVNTGYLDTDYIMPAVSREEMMQRQSARDRDAAIEAWFNHFKGTDESFAKVCAVLKTFARPGDGIKVNLHGREYQGHVVQCPNTFPDGYFTLRAFVPNERMKNGYEFIILRRKHHEFELATPDAVMERDLEEVMAS